MLGNYSLCPVSPWWLKLCPSKCSPLGIFFILGAPFDESSYHYRSYLSLSHFILFISLYFGIFGYTEPRRDCTSFHGKKGLKAQRECSWKKIKSKTINFQMLTQGGIKNDETLLLKNQRPARNNFILYRCPTR
jgi:hypothetical protein